MKKVHLYKILHQVMSAFTASGKGYENPAPRIPGDLLAAMYSQQASQVYCCYQDCKAFQREKKLKFSLPISYHSSDVSARSGAVRT